MGRNYKPKPEGTRYKKLDPEVFKKAKNDVNIHGMSIGVAAVKYKIAYTVLHHHLKMPVVKMQGGQTMLTKQEEKCIVEKLLPCSEWGYPHHTLDLQIIVQHYLNRSGRVIQKFKENLLVMSKYQKGTCWGTVETVTEAGYEGHFLGPKITRDHSDYTYTYPVIPGRYEFTFEKIIAKLPDPETYGRGLLYFKINLSD